MSMFWKYVLIIPSFVCLVLFVNPHSYTEDNSDRIIAIAWSPDGTRIATANLNGTIGIIDVLSGQQTNRLTGHTDSVYAIAWSPDGNQLASASADQTVRIWSTLDGTMRLRLDGHLDSPFAIIWSLDGNKIFSGSMEEAENLRVWDATTGVLIHSVGSGSVANFSINPTTRQLTTANPVGMVAIYEPVDLTLTNNITQPEGFGNGYDVYHAIWNNMGMQIITTSLNGVMRIWDVSTRQIILELQASDSTEVSYLTTSVKALDLNMNNNSVSGIAADGTYRIWDVNSGQLLRQSQLPFPIRAAAFSPDHSLVAYALDTASQPQISSALTISTQSITSFTFISVVRDRDIHTLTNGDIINLSTEGNNLVIRAETDPAEVGSVVFEVDGENFIDNTAPYEWEIPGAGEYTLRATPYSESDGMGQAGGELWIRFTVVD